MMYPRLLIRILFGLTVILSGCRPTPPEQEHSPVDKVVLRIGTAEPVRSANILLDIHLAMLAHLSNPPLMRMAPDGRIVGLAAAGAVAGNDATSWTFTLRPDWRWSDGRPLTAGDAAFTLEYIRKFYPPASWMKQAIATVTTPDRLTMTLRLARSNHRLAADFTTYKLLPRHTWEKVADPLRDPAPGQNVGCGPFVIESVDLQRGLIRFVRNAYWPGPEPHLDEIEIHLFHNRDVLTFALEKDEIDIPYDYADSFPPANLERILRDPGITLLESPGAGLFFLGFNLKKSPMSDLRFREAAAAALDFREILRLFLLGYGRVPDRGLIPDTLPFHHPEARLERNLRRAEGFLEELGLRDRDEDGIREDGSGRPAEFTLLTAPEHIRLAELVRTQMKEAGLALIVKSVDGASWVALKDDYRYDLILAKTSPWGLASHAGWGTAYFDARRSGEGVLHTVDDPAFLQLCDALLASGDEAERAALARKVREDYARRLPAVALCWNTIVVPHRRRFTGWTWDPLYGFFNLETFVTVRRADR